MRLATTMLAQELMRVRFLPNPAPITGNRNMIDYGGEPGGHAEENDHEEQGGPPWRLERTGRDNSARGAASQNSRDDVPKDNRPGPEMGVFLAQINRVCGHEQDADHHARRHHRQAALIPKSRRNRRPRSFRERRHHDVGGGAVDHPIAARPGHVRCRPGRGPMFHRARRTTVRLVTLTLSVWDWNQRSRGYWRGESSWVSPFRILLKSDLRTRTSIILGQ